jgi:apolipoprotein N-acyltransferase
MFITRVFGGFPWNLLGTTQYKLVPLIQVASVTGVYGVSFLVVWFSLALTSACLQLLRNPGKRQALILEIILPVLVIAVLFNQGFRQIRHAPPETRTCKVALIQPSIPQTLIWDSSKDDERFEELLRITEAAVTNSPSLVVWPEAAVPKLLRYDQEVFERITSIARRHKLWMILGADDAEPKRDDPKEADYFNSSFLVSPEGKLVDHYKKRALVIFGEYLPLRGWLPFLKWFTPIQGGFTPGDKPSQFHLSDLGLNTSVLICYEDIFPLIARGGAMTDTDFLVNITNDGWFGEGAAQWQQGISGLFRAVENRIPLVRCTNNGLTCWIDGYGRIRQIFRDSSGSVYGKGYMLFELPLPERDSERTFFNRHGDVFGWLCVAVSGVTFLVNLGKRRSAASSKEPSHTEPVAS